MNSRTAACLHVTNGDAVIHGFKKAGILGTHLAWRDVLHEGPVPGTVPLEECSRVRGAYLASRGFGRPIRIMQDLANRDALIRRASEFEEVVLWFEHDLYDQLQILQILAFLRALEPAPVMVSLVQSDHYLGALSGDELLALYPKRRTVTRAMFDRAQALWADFTSPEPLALGEQTKNEHPGFAHMRAALERLCEEFPAPGDGLSRSARQALAAVAQGPARKEELFARAQGREEAPFLGDATFYAILSDLQRSPAPLVEGTEALLQPTALGRRVLGGDADWLEHAPADRWIGGIHLHGAHPPRWDTSRRAFITAEEAVD
ncbi:MAG TPA: hypothetical protein VFN49_02645 [Candidatus Aquilonibacter sp.]|nr:hypothetical protein [Candidatus Aquilonibacter sp.]